MWEFFMWVISFYVYLGGGAGCHSSQQGRWSWVLALLFFFWYFFMAQLDGSEKNRSKVDMFRKFGKPILKFQIFWVVHVGIKFCDKMYRFMFSLHVDRKFSLKLVESWIRASTVQALKPSARIMFLAVSAKSPSIPGFGFASLLKESPGASLRFLTKRFDRTLLHSFLAPKTSALRWS
jgi:hypothetical protein